MHEDGRGAREEGEGCERNLLRTDQMLDTDPVLKADAPKDARGLPRARILIVDDSPANLTALQAVLEPLGQEVVQASSGEQALWHLLRSDGDFAVILMDVQMPGLSGLETARLIKTRERTRSIPLIFITALSREMAFITQGYQHGAVDYLLKPVVPDILRSKVSVFVELYQQRELLKRQAVELAERKRAEEEMRRAAELEQRILGIVGHDIRSPLGAILTTTQAQLRGGELSAAQRRAFERIGRGGERIRQVVDLLLDFTRACIGGGIPVVRRVSDLRALCAHLLDEVGVRAPGRQLVAELGEGPIEGEWDPDRLTQVFANLLDNALKYGPPDRPVRLRLSADAASVALEVHNEGPAIPEEARAHLFEPFRRGATDDAAAPQSLGLGLYIVHEVVRAHGGRVEVESAEGTGTTFRICLPRWQGDGGRRPDPCAVQEAASA